MPKDNEVDEKAPVYVVTAPERIYLQVADDAYYAEDPFPAEEEVTWCADSVMELEVSYVREDLHAATVAELRAEVESERKLRLRAEGLCSQWITRHDFALESLNELTADRNAQRDRADAAERRVGELEVALRNLRDAFVFRQAIVASADTIEKIDFADSKAWKACDEAKAALTGADPT